MLFAAGLEVGGTEGAEKFEYPSGGLTSSKNDVSLSRCSS